MLVALKIETRLLSVGTIVFKYFRDRGFTLMTELIPCLNLDLKKA